MAFYELIDFLKIQAFVIPDVYGISVILCLIIVG